MTDFEPSHELPPEPNSRGLQFSTWSLLVILTAVSVLLAVLLGIGRAVGMSNAEIVESGFLQRFLYILPMLVVWSVGLMLSFGHLRRGDRNAELLVVAFIGLIVTSVVVNIVQMVLIFQITKQGAFSLTWGFSILSVFSVLLNTVWWVLILMAIFRGRSEATHPEEADHLEHVYLEELSDED